MPRKQISKKMREKIYAKYGGHCAYCGVFMHYKNMQVDHMDSVYRTEIHGKNADNSEENYMPACRSCNFYKSTLTLEEFRKRLETARERLQKNFVYRIAVRYGLIEEKEMDVVFYFEKDEAEKDRAV